MKEKQFIRDQVLRGITLNRVPGYHFVGNFLEVSFDHISVEDKETPDGRIVNSQTKQPFTYAGDPCVERGVTVA